jgi:penicillin-binding protein 1C
VGPPAGASPRGAHPPWRRFAPPSPIKGEGKIVVALIALLAAQVALAALDLVLPPDLSRAERSSPVALDRRGAWLRALPVEDGRWRIRADLARTDPAFVRRLIATEDARFRLHPGVDPLALARAAASNAARGQTVSGGSTLTMQTARLLEPRPRTLGAKAVEALRAVQLEARFSKDQLLAMYLTLAPYGGNLEGVRAASLAYFGHEPETLTDAEAALLIALPAGARRRAAPTAARAAARARDAVLARWGAWEAVGEPAPGRTRFPALAWHAAGEAPAPPRSPGVGGHHDRRRPADAGGASGRRRRRGAGAGGDRRGAGRGDAHPRRARGRGLGGAGPRRRAGST